MGRILKTWIDPQEPGHEVILGAIAKIIERGESKSEAGAVRRLLYASAAEYARAQSPTPLPTIDKVPVKVAPQPAAKRRSGKRTARSSKRALKR